MLQQGEFYLSIHLHVESLKLVDRFQQNFAFSIYTKSCQENITKWSEVITAMQMYTELWLCSLIV